MASNPTAPQDKNKTSSQGILFIVATPIGNLSDMTYRAVDTLKSVDLIACEDTRTSATLLKHFDIATTTTSYHDHNGAKQRPMLLERLQSGQSVALISDAGTPLISDPGYKLVAEAAELGIRVVPIPGASSVICALSACGLPTDRFTFLGFLPTKQGARTDMLGHIQQIDGTLVLLESPKRLLDTLKDLEALGNRNIVVARELTKKFEELRRGNLSELIEQYASESTPKGEIVLLIGPADKRVFDDDAVDALLEDALAKHPTKEAAAQVAKTTGLSKSDLYQRALALK